MSKYKCVIFDCDGVLVDSEPIGNQVLVDMANTLGAKIDLDYAYRHFKGNALNKCMLHIEELIEGNLPPNFESEYRKQSFERFKNEIKPVEGVEELINTLDLPFCVASSGPENKIRLNLKLTGLLPYFEGKIFSCYAVQKWKPDPAVFLWAAKTMGFKPQECLVIEDSPLGVDAALNGGFPVFGFTAHDCNNSLEGKVEVTFKAMRALSDLITKR